MTQKMNKQLIVILGMHRSGTSAITRGLKALGVDLGDHLMQAISGNNDKGFWEDLDIYAFNNELLNCISHDWHSNVPITQSEFDRKDLSSLRQRAVELLRQKTQSASVFGIKNPHIARLLPFWKKIFDQVGLDAGYVITVRHPMSVAQSLKKRDGFDVEKSYYLWLGHVVPSILESEGHPRVVVNYDLLMDHPEEQLLRIAQQINLTNESINAHVLEEYKNDFLEEGLRHTRFRPEDLMHDPAVPKDVMEAYDALERLARDELSVDTPEVHDTFTQLNQRLRDISPALKCMTNLEGRLAERDGQITCLLQTMTERDRQINHMIRSWSWRLTRPLRLIAWLARYE